MKCFAYNKTWKKLEKSSYTVAAAQWDNRISSLLPSNISGPIIYKPCTRHVGKLNNSVVIIIAFIFAQNDPMKQQTMYYLERLCR